MESVSWLLATHLRYRQLLVRAYRTKCILFGRFARESNILQWVVSAGDCLPRLTRLVPGIAAIDLFNEERSRKLFKVSIFPSSGRSTSRTPWVIQSTLSRLSLALRAGSRLDLDSCTVLLFMSIILLLKDIKLAPATTLLLRNIVIFPRPILSYTVA
jgi:hypothetical protein